MTKSLAVIETNLYPYQLVVEQEGEYWTIPGIATLAEAMQLRLEELRKAVEARLEIKSSVR